VIKGVLKIHAWARPFGTSPLHGIALIRSTWQVKDMVHVGKNYPYWQISRLFDSGTSWPLLAPTEYEYELIDVSGPGASGMILNGRGMLPQTYNQGDYTMTYSGNVGSYLTLPYTLVLIYGINSNNQPITINVQLFWGSTLIGQLFFPIQWPNFNSNPWESNWTGWDAIGVAPPITNLFIAHMLAVLWTATPPPPAPHIY
jgi:hypothetical protein